MSHRILLVDDELDILEFVGYNLQREGYDIRTATNGAEALEVAASFRPHLILLDRMMPVMDGVETCRALRQDPTLRRTHIVFLSALGEEDDQLTGFDAGADDYLPKPIPMKLLVSRVRAILNRIEQPSQTTEKQSDIRLDANRHTVITKGEEIQLPRKEFALLELLIDHAGELVSREEIYTTIWGHEVVVGDRTIDVHIRKLRKKIGEEHIHTIKGVGYMYEK
ncbi:MAG: response regulator transcription factor [Alistipes sp.]|nr:response regulator transcription factor [Alistipes sp.]